MSGGTSIPAMVSVPQPQNPLQQVGQYAETANALMGLQNNQLVMGGRAAYANALANTPTDPKTGLPDYPTLIDNLRQSGPSGALMIPQVIQGMQQQQAATYQLNAAGLKQSTDRLAQLRSGLGPLVALGNNVQPSDVYRTINGLHAAGLPTDEIVNYAANTMPSLDPASANDPNAQAAYQQRLAGWVKNTWAGGLGGSDQMRFNQPNPTATNTGGSITFQDINPNTNPGVVGSSLPMQLTPSEQNAQVPAPPGPGGAPQTQSGAAYAVRSGNGALVPGYTGAPNTPSPVFGNGRPGGVPGNLRNPNAPAAAAAGNPAAAPPMPTGLAPGDLSASTAAGTDSANALNTLYQTAGSSPGRIFQLQSALNGVLGAGATGPGTETANRIASFLQSNAPFGLGKYLPGVDPNQIKSYDEANKYLTQYASNLGAAQGSDTKLATALSGNASTHISQLAAQDVIRATIGMERFQQAQAQAFQRTGLPASQFNAWSANNWARSADPRAYAMDLMSPAQRQTVINSLPATPDASGTSARSRFFDQVWNAAQNGLIDPGVLGGAGNASATAPSASTPPAAASLPSVNLGSGYGGQ